MKTSLALLLLALLLPQDPAPAGFGPKERAAIAEALHAINLQPADLNYAKGPLDDSYRLGLVRRTLHDPLSIPAVSDDLLAPCRRGASPVDVLARLVAELQGGAGIKIDDLQPAEVAPPKTDLPEAGVAALVRLAGAWKTAVAEREKAFAKLPPAARAALETQVVGLVLDEEDLGVPAPPDPAAAWAALDLVDWAPLWRAGLFVARELERAGAELRIAAPAWSGTARIGDVLVAGVGHDRHDHDAKVIVDLAGDDSYSGAAASAWIFDLAGHDRYRGGISSIGCGLLDVRAVVDLEGDDVYEAEALSQGFGAFGLGVLIDEKGDDTYRVQLYGQGASRTWGAGLLADRAGRDLYQAGGRVIHKPLLEKEKATFGFAQGFSIGYRPDRSGGIAALWDGDGDDVYIGGTYTQGASYWFSFTVLADDAGNDRYTAFYYSQASAMHLTVAALIDRAGHDVYACHMGAIHAIGHDWGVALLWDAGGNDVYAGDSAPGCGVANGVGIFVDSGGDDKYGGPPAAAGPARDSGSVALFVDLGGKDRYGRGLADGGLSVKPFWGAARDVEDPPPPPPGQEPAGKVPIENPQKWHDAVGSKPLAPEAELEAIYAEAGLWAVGSTRDRAWIGRRALIEMGLPAAEWMAKKKLATAESLQIEAFDVVFREIGPETGKFLVEPLRSANRKEVENALRMAAQLRAPQAKDEVLRLLKDPAYRRPACGAAGALKLAEAVPLLVEAAKSMDGFGKLVVAKSLGAIGDPAAAAWLEGNFEGAELPVREASADGLAKCGAEGRKILERLAASPKPSVARAALRALAIVDGPEALAAEKSRAADPDWGVRLTVLQALKSMKAEGAAKAAEELLATEKDARVRSAAGWLDPEKNKW